jgi:hypothetical protein
LNTVDNFGRRWAHGLSNINPAAGFDLETALFVVLRAGLHFAWLAFLSAIF